MAHTHTHTSTHIRIPTRTRTRTHTYTLAHTHTYTFIHIHTHTHTHTEDFFLGQEDFIFFSGGTRTTFTDRDIFSQRVLTLPDPLVYLASVSCVLCLCFVFWRRTASSEVLNSLTRLESCTCWLRSALMRLPRSFFSTSAYNPFHVLSKKSRVRELESLICRR